MTTTQIDNRINLDDLTVLREYRSFGKIEREVAGVPVRHPDYGAATLVKVVDTRGTLTGTIIRRTTVPASYMRAAEVRTDRIEGVFLSMLTTTTD